jgi:hypothetical protein
MQYGFRFVVPVIDVWLGRENVTILNVSMRKGGYGKLDCFSE